MVDRLNDIQILASILETGFNSQEVKAPVIETHPLYPNRNRKFRSAMYDQEGTVVAEILLGAVGRGMNGDEVMESRISSAELEARAKASVILLSPLNVLRQAGCRLFRTAEWSEPEDDAREPKDITDFNWRPGWNPTSPEQLIHIEGDVPSTSFTHLIAPKPIIEKLMLQSGINEEWFQKHGIELLVVDQEDRVGRALISGPLEEYGVDLVPAYQDALRKIADKIDTIHLVHGIGLPTDTDLNPVIEEYDDDDFDEEDY